MWLSSDSCQWLGAAGQGLQPLLTLVFSTKLASIVFKFPRRNQYATQTRGESLCLLLSTYLRAENVPI